MNLTVIILIFFTTFLTGAALLYAFSGEDLTVARRLSRMWEQTYPTKDPTSRIRPAEAAEDVLAKLGKFMPVSQEEISRKQIQILQAGIRRPAAAKAARGLMIALPIVFLSAVYFTGIYQLSPFLILVCAGSFGYLAPDLWLRLKVHNRQARLRLSLPDALDLMVICVEAGLGLDQAILRVSQELKLAHPELAEELSLVNLEMRVGKSRLDALRAFSLRTGVDDIKTLVAMLVQTDRFGTSLAQSLRIHSDDVRVRRRQRAEELAAKTTVKMLIPLVLFIFPALMIVILGPAVITIIRQFLPAFK
jgi:tight adherence protein C